MSAVPERSLEVVSRPPLTLVPDFEPQPPNAADLAERFKKFGNNFISAYDQEVGRLIEGPDGYPFNPKLWHTYGRVALESLEIGALLANFEQPAAVVEKNGTPWDLSNKLLDVFKVLPQGMTDSQLSEALGLSRATIQGRVKEIQRKTGSHNRVQAGLLAYQAYKDKIAPQPQVDLKLFDQLSPAETKVLGLLEEGLANVKLAERLHLTLHTVKFYLNHLYRKLNINNKTSAAIFAYEARQARLLESQTEDREEEFFLSSPKAEPSSPKSTVPKAQTRRENKWSLTPKELETFGYLAYGLSDNEISQKVGRSKAGVHNRIERILDKTGSRNRTDAAVLAYLYNNRGHQIFEKECKLAKQLEPRQLEVLEHIYEYTNRQQLADALGIKPRTLTWHINKINKELGTVNGVQLSLISYQLAKDQSFKRIKAEHELTIYEQQQGMIRTNQEKELHKRVKAEIKEWRAEENVYVLRDERQLARYIKRPKEDGRSKPSSDKSQSIADSKKEDSPKRPSTMSLDNLAEDGFPIGFVEQIEELEERLRHPPPHAEIVKILRASGW